MQALVVHAHPSSESLSASLTEAVVRGLRRGGHDIVVADLHADGFRAAMTPDERRAYHSGTPILDPLVQRYADLVQRSEILVFVYPTWWLGPPALLKGFFDRVLVPGVAFGFDDAGRVRGRLTHVRRLVGVTTSGSSRIVVRLSTDGGRRTIMRSLGMNVGWRCRRTWMSCAGIEQAEPAAIATFVRTVEDRAASW